MNSFLSNFYRHLVIFSGHTGCITLCSEHCCAVPCHGLWVHTLVMANYLLDPSTTSMMLFQDSIWFIWFNTSIWLSNLWIVNSKIENWNKLNLFKNVYLSFYNQLVVAQMEEMSTRILPRCWTVASAWQSWPCCQRCPDSRCEQRLDPGGLVRRRECKEACDLKFE